MSEEIEKRLSLLPKKDKVSMTEIYQIDGDTIEEITVKFKSGNIIILR